MGSAVATLVLAQNQFDVVSLDGGIRQRPFRTVSVEEAMAEQPRAAIANQLNR